MHLLQNFKSVSDHFTTLRSKGLNPGHFNPNKFQKQWLGLYEKCSGQVVALNIFMFTFLKLLLKVKHKNSETQFLIQEFVKTLILESARKLPSKRLARLLDIVNLARQQEQLHSKSNYILEKSAGYQTFSCFLKIMIMKNLLLHLNCNFY